MDIVIPYINSASNGFELRYTLRGIEKYFPDLENIFIIGDCPEFLQNVIHIPATDSTERHFKARNIMSKLLIACNDKRVSDSFAMFNDDHFLLKPFTGEYYHCGSLKETLNRYSAHQTYRNTLVNTLSILEDGNNFDGHCPIIFRKEIFIRTVNTVNWATQWGFGIKSLYCNLAGVAGIYLPDLKIKQNLNLITLANIVSGMPFFSIDDRALNVDMITLLNKLYPSKSNYESD